jgi:CubicO group peptidase (beta-lactamase class C family)
MLATLLLLVVGGGWVGASPDPGHPVDEIFAPFDNTRSPGCAVGVVEKGQLRLARGYGMASLDHGEPLDARSIFRTASVSKQFSAAVVLLLESEGFLSLDDDIRLHIPEMRDPGAKVTVRHLVHHTSGLRDYLALMSLRGVGDDDIYHPEDVVAVLARQEGLNFAPGDDYLYSNSGYFLISELVKRLTGLTLREYADRRIFSPLGMVRTHFHDDHTEVVPNRAVGYAPRDEGGFRISTTRLNLVGDGGVFTSIEDMARWEGFLMAGDGGAGGTSGTLPASAPGVPSPTAEPPAWLPGRMLERGVLNGGEPIDYAFGIQHGSHRGLPTVGHGGSFAGYRTHVVRFPEQALSVVVLCNLSSADPATLARRVAEVYLEDEMDPPPPDPTPAEVQEEEEPFPQPPPRALAAFAGEWWSEELQVRYRIQVEGDTLRLVEPRNLAGSLVAEGPDTFRLRGATFRFLRTSGEARPAGELRVDTGRARDLRFLREGT